MTSAWLVSTLQNHPLQKSQSRVLISCFYWSTLIQVFHVNTGLSHSLLTAGWAVFTVERLIKILFQNLPRWCVSHICSPRLFLVQALAVFFFSPPSFTPIVLQFDASSGVAFLLGAAGLLLLTVKKTFYLLGLQFLVCALREVLLSLCVGVEAWTLSVCISASAPKTHSSILVPNESGSWL